MEGSMLRVTNPLDNVATAVDDILAGTRLTVATTGEPLELEALDDVPFGQSVAIKPIGRGQPVVRGGVRIGFAPAPLQPGQRADV